MKIRELAKYCESIDIDCDKCEHKKECQKLAYELDEISAIGVVELIDSNKELS